MILIESNSVMRGVQDQIFVLANMRVLFGLATSRLCGQVKLATTLPSQCWASLVWVPPSTDRSSATTNRQGDIAGRRVPPLIVSMPSPTIRVLSSTANCQGATDLVASKPKKALVTRGVDRGSHRSQRMDLHTCPTVGANCHGL
jgi:hypothetical protein